MQIPHRKTIRHFDELNHVHELTFSCFQRLPLLVDNEWREQFCMALDRAIARHQYRLLAYVLMPEHVHLIVHPQPDGSSVSDLLRAIKRPFSYRIKQRLIESNSSLLNKLTIRQRPGVMTFRFWQEGPGFDRNLTESSTIVAAVNYVHLNPVRRGLCERAVDWKWSSARWFEASEDNNTEIIPRLHRLDPEMLQ